MKTYLLRNPNAVEPQIERPTAPVDPVAAAITSDIVAASQPPGTSPRLILYVGLDVHNDSIAVSLAPSDSTQVRRYGIIGGSHDEVLKLSKKLQAAHPGSELKLCYEAGPRN
jgi:hypothetical protein